jgi:hypothetical protein
MEEDVVVVVVELYLLASNIKRRVYNVKDDFLSFIKIFYERNNQNMFALMLDLKYKNLGIIFNFLGKELGINVIE